MTAATAMRVRFSSGRRRRAREQLAAAVVDVARTDRFILKDSVAELERLARERTGAGAVVACGSRAGGLVLAASACGIGRDDPVAVPASAGPAVVAAVDLLGARPVPVDVSPGSGLPDPAELAGAGAALGLVDHPLQVPGAGPLGGPGMTILHDATGLADALLATWPDGRWDSGAVAALSADGALLGAGEGALIVTGEEPGRTARMLRNHGQDGVHRFLHHLVGCNSRMDELVAAFAVAMLAGADRARERTASLAARYDARADDLRARSVHPVGAAGAARGAGYAVLCDRRDSLLATLTARGIEFGARPVPPPWLNPAAHPGAAALLRTAVLLPLHPDLTEDQVDEVLDAVTAAGRGPS